MLRNPSWDPQEFQQLKTQRITSLQSQLTEPEARAADAISTIFNKLDPEICRHCTARIFWECKTAPGPDTPTA